MNKNEAKSVKVETVVSHKKTGEKFVVSNVSTEDEKVFNITVYNDSVKGVVYSHQDLKIEEDLTKNDVLTEIMNKPELTEETNNEEIEVEKTSTKRSSSVSRSQNYASRCCKVYEDEYEFTQEKYDNMGVSAKRCVNEENTVVYPANEEGKFISKTVGSKIRIEITAENLNRAKRIRNAFKA